MRRLFSAGVLILCVLTVGAAVAQRGSTYEQVVVGTGPRAFSATMIEPLGGPVPLQCFVRAEFHSIRYRVDGVQATGTVGFPLLASQVDGVDLTPAQASLWSMHAAGVSPSNSAQVIMRCW